MSDVDWSDVPQPVTEEPKKEGGILGTLIFAVLLIAGLVVGLGYVNYVMLGERARQIVLDEGGDPVHVRQEHERCYSNNVTLAAPQSLAAFQTPKTSPEFGIGTVDMAAYRTCVLPMKAK